MGEHQEAEGVEVDNMKVENNMEVDKVVCRVERSTYLYRQEGGTRTDKEADKSDVQVGIMVADMGCMDHMDFQDRVYMDLAGTTWEDRKAGDV